MQKIIKEVDQARGLMQVTVADERWYLKPSKDPVSGIPTYLGVPSVTWVASFYPKGIEFYKWLAETGWDEAQALKKAAGDKGSVVHLAIDMILSGMEFRIDTKVTDKSRSTPEETYERELTYEELLCVKSFCDWKAEMEKDYIIETIVNEHVLFSELHNVAGTIDWLVKLTHRVTGEIMYYLIDFKTSKYIWMEQRIQVSTYKRLIENGENPIFEKNANGTNGKVIDLSNLKIAILQLGYERNKNLYKFTELEDVFDLFLVAQQIWKVEAGTQAPKVRDFPLILSKGTEVRGEIVVGDPEPELGPGTVGETEPSGVEPTPIKKGRIKKQTVNA